MKTNYGRIVIYKQDYLLPCKKNNSEIRNFEKKFAGAKGSLQDSQ
jgi:hypothetical protein